MRLRGETAGLTKLGGSRAGPQAHLALSPILLVHFCLPGSQTSPQFWPQRPADGVDEAPAASGGANDKEVSTPEVSQCQGAVLAVTLVDSEVRKGHLDNTGVALW